MTLPSRMISVREAAVFLCVSERQVRALIARPEDDPDRLPCSRVGGRVVLDPSRVMAWLDRDSKKVGRR